MRHAARHVVDATLLRHAELPLKPCFAADADDVERRRRML